jgi:hypothetical protein
MPIFQPVIPAYENAGRQVAHVENGCGLLGLWPRPVYLNDPRAPSCGGGGGMFGGLFTASQPGYTFPETATAALVERSEKTTKPRR